MQAQISKSSSPSREGHSLYSHSHLVQKTCRGSEAFDCYVSDSGALSERLKAMCHFVRVRGDD